MITDATDLRANIAGSLAEKLRDDDSLEVVADVVLDAVIVAMYEMLSWATGMRHEPKPGELSGLDR
ncbi:hypothetical protein [Mycobacteroides abscessus]|uniref:hypothetical protein n=1 Tax=Mycobacteroides abscessus TaxID=36809 RepID=UPI0009A93021|nr:hypothetical protein [Mycobacteroides abscessus]